MIETPDVEQQFRNVGDRLADIAVRPLLWAGITADQVTWIGLYGSFFVAVFLYQGLYPWATVMLLCLGACDWLDGQVARRTGCVSARGALLDATTDRVSDALPFVALMLSPSSRPILVWSSVAALLVNILIPYIKAKAESLGCTLHGALLPRAPRFILLLVGVAFGPPVLTAAVGLIAVFGAFTVYQRTTQAFRQLS